jgi:YTH domain-containing family protein
VEFLLVYLDTTYGYDRTGAHFPWYGGSAYANGQQRKMTNNHIPPLIFNDNDFSARNLNKSTMMQQMVSQRKCIGNIILLLNAAVAFVYFYPS